MCAQEDVVSQERLVVGHKDAIENQDRDAGKTNGKTVEIFSLHLFNLKYRDIVCKVPKVIFRRIFYITSAYHVSNFQIYFFRALSPLRIQIISHICFPS